MISVDVWNGFKDIMETLTPLFVAAIGGWFTVWVTKIQHERKERKRENESLKKDKDDLSMGVEFDIQTFNSMQQILTGMFTETKFDNFMMMTAMNGQRDFRFVSALYEQHSQKAAISLGATGRYVKFQFDQQFRDILKNLELNGELDFTVTEMTQSDLKLMFEADGYKESKLIFVARAKINDENDRIFFFMLSSKSSVDDNDRIKAKAYMSGLKDIVKTAIESNQE